MTTTTRIFLVLISVFCSLALSLDAGATHKQKPTLPTPRGPFYIVKNPIPVATGRIVSIDCIDRQATIETQDCQTLQVGFSSSSECHRHEHGDVIQVYGEKQGDTVAADRTANLGAPTSFSGTITSTSCEDERIVVESCGRTCNVAIDEEECRAFKYGDKVDISGTEIDRDTGCIELAESIQKQSPNKNLKRGPLAGGKLSGHEANPRKKK